MEPTIYEIKELRQKFFQKFISEEDRGTLKG